MMRIRTITLPPMYMRSPPFRQSGGSSPPQRSGPRFGYAVRYAHVYGHPQACGQFGALTARRLAMGRGPKGRYEIHGTKPMQRRLWMTCHGSVNTFGEGTGPARPWPKGTGGVPCD